MIDHLLYVFDFLAIIPFKIWDRVVMGFRFLAERRREDNIGQKDETDDDWYARQW